MSISRRAVSNAPASFESYDAILNRDSRQVPEQLRQKPRCDVGLDSVPVSHFYDQHYFAKEVKHVWMRVWQWACREEEIPNVGDCHVYDVVGRSLIVVRVAPDRIKAFHNSCPHRARRLVTLSGNKGEFRCPFHGMTWNCDGSLKENPMAWDFPQLPANESRLPEVNVETWSGFVFVNFDPNCAPLHNCISPIAADFARYDYDKRYIAVNLSKVVRANWKVVAEAFMESHHSVATHPQILPGTGDANSQYDLLSDYVSRHFTAAGVASPLLDRRPSELETVTYMLNRALTDKNRRTLPEGTAIPEKLPEGVTARAFMGDVARRGLQLRTGRSYDHATDAELLDALQYGLFPHMSFWASFGPALVYRWRPHGLDPEMSIMDVLILAPKPEGKPVPASAAPIALGPDDPMQNAADALGQAAIVLSQDMSNLPYVQQGLRSSGSGVVHYGQYTEMRIRHMHHMIDNLIAQGEAS